MRSRVFTTRNIVLALLLLFVLFLFKLVHHCMQGKDEFQEQINLTNINHIKQRETLLKQKEDHVTRTINILGINTNYLSDKIPTIYIVTPTHTRLTQKAELTRLYQTLLHIPQIHWMIVEDAKDKTLLVKRFLKDCVIPHTHLNIKTRNELIRGQGEPRWLKNRGVEQRNLAIEWMRKNVPSQEEAVVYFADDDNTYDLKIFEMMRYTRRVSVWPVGIVGSLVWEGPICKNGKVVKFRTSFAPERPLPLDMAGFAINLRLLKENTDAEMDVYAKRGFVESSIVSRLVETHELEGLASDCTKVLVWHTQTVTPRIKREQRTKEKYKGIEPEMEV